MALDHGGGASRGRGGVRVAARAAANVPGAVAVPASLVMMTASLVAMLAVAMAAVFRHTL